MAIILVFAIVVGGMALTLAVGGQVVASSQSQLDVSRAETTMTQLDSQAAMVALGNSEAQRIRLSGGSGSRYAVAEDAGWVNVTYRDVQTGAEHAVVERQRMGAIVYENGGERIAYQGGGVWRGTGDDSVMVSPPEFHYRNATLTFPLVSVSGSGELGDEVTLSDAETTALYPNRTRDPTFRNPLEDGRATVTIHSEYYRGWGQYFETRTGGVVEYDHANESVSLGLVVPGENPPVEGGIVTAPSTELEIWNHAKADSYNSSTAPYGTFPDGSNTTIVADSDVTVHNHATLHGSLEADGRVTVGNHGRLAGNVSHDGLTVARHGQIDGWSARNASVTAPSPVDGVIDDRIESAKSDNDNDDPTVDVDESTNTLEDCDSTCRLTAGTYYLDWLALDRDDTLVLDTSGGVVDVVVDGPVQVDGDHPSTSDPEVRVVGDGRANVYTNGDVIFHEQAAVDVEDDRAPAFWTFTKSDSNVEFRNHARYQGVVYGPGGAGGTGTHMELDNHAEVFGGLVGDVEFVSNHYAIHYDEALSSVEPVEVDNSVPALTYLHVSANDVNVTSD